MKTKLKLTMLLILACAGSQLPAMATTVNAVDLGSIGSVTVTNSLGKAGSLSSISTGCTVCTSTTGDCDLDLVPGACSVLYPGTDVTVSSLTYTPGLLGLPALSTETVNLKLTQGSILCNLAVGGAPCNYCVVTPGGTVTIPASLCTQGTLVSYSPKTGLVITKVPFPVLPVSSLLANLCNTSGQQTVSCNL